VKLFGRDMTKQGALMLILNDQHEHLGQSIAYARSNSVVPPWFRSADRLRKVLVHGIGSP
jgi:uncharacterized damage-inducible protein DinB